MIVRLINVFFIFSHVIDLLWLWIIKSILNLTKYSRGLVTWHGCERRSSIIGAFPQRYWWLRFWRFSGFIINFFLIWKIDNHEYTFYWKVKLFITHSTDKSGDKVKIYSCRYMFQTTTQEIVKKLSSEKLTNLIKLQSLRSRLLQLAFY